MIFTTLVYRWGLIGLDANESQIYLFQWAVGFVIFIIYSLVYNSIFYEDQVLRARALSDGVATSCGKIEESVLMYLILSMPLSVLYVAFTPGLGLQATTEYFMVLAMALSIQYHKHADGTVWVPWVVGIYSLVVLMVKNYVAVCVEMETKKYREKTPEVPAERDQDLDF
ncbi:hypothetical protein O6P43_019052 [Quillaja saponaria]|uniref:Uncharacterized protein n=1 Tax=Quillaja saponaria TaxID=32244 RepID=A0AAD7PJV8_QUISA|nr:hypothetical protein O6P43_019052 [Quillaja saponaria]